MSINGLASLRYVVEDMDECIRFFQDLGLSLVESSQNDYARFELPEGSSVELFTANCSPALECKVNGFGVKEIVWGIDSQAALDRLANDLAGDMKITRDADGGIHFTPHFGISMGIKVFTKKPVISSPNPQNAPGHVGRLNSPRKWRKRALPKVLQHVVFQIADEMGAVDFMCKRLNFRVSDIQDGVGTYLRAPKSNSHHNLLLLNANGPFPECDGTTKFHHTNFGVEDIDELMIGINYMMRKGWAPSEIGLGRHRVDSALFYYLPSPTGGEVELGADGDFVDDSWLARRWTEPLFAYSHFTHNLPPFLLNEPTWKFSYLDESGVTTVNKSDL